MSIKNEINRRFRGLLPVVIDVETGGLNPEKDALLELAAITTQLVDGQLVCDQTFHYHVEPFEGANLDPKAMEINHIKPHHPFRFAKTEAEMLTDLFTNINQALKDSHCRRAVLVGHNANFDLSFLLAASKRCKIKRPPFHGFTVFDTATLAGVAYGQTILARALQVANIEFDINEAHSALYDTEKTAELFCKIVNQWPNKRHHARKSS